MVERNGGAQNPFWHQLGLSHIRLICSSPPLGQGVAICEG